MHVAKKERVLVKDSKSGKKGQAELQKKYNPREVIFIFQKEI